MDKIENLRQQINISERIGKIKSNSKKDVLDLKREDYVLNKAKEYNHSRQLELVYKTIMNESKNIQRR
jgi:chorismate mutase